MKPSFIIIGGVKCASSSLYRYLNGHPNVLPCKTKEPMYFNTKNPLRLIKGYKKYIQLFPQEGQKRVHADWLEIGNDKKIKESKFSKEIDPTKDYITGEATASLFIAANPRYIKLLFPNIKIILLLRDPSERYISHFKMFQRFENEGRKNFTGFQSMIEYVDKEIVDFNNNKTTRLIHQGVYSNYLPKWKKIFNNQLKVINTRNLSNVHSNQTLNDVISFLGLEKFDFSDVLEKKHNVSPKDKDDYKHEKIRLDEFYTPYNNLLFQKYNHAL